MALSAFLKKKGGERDNAPESLVKLCDIGKVVYDRRGLQPSEANGGLGAKFTAAAKFMPFFFSKIMPFRDHF